jgi:uncharacterized protein YqgC (DUF456 family)
MEYLWAALFLFSVAAGWVLTLFSLPGNWVMVATAAIYAALMPSELRVAIGWPVVFTLLGLAVLGEIVEFAAGAMGAVRGGGSKRGAILAAVGSVPGAMIGAAVGVPIPVLGSIVGVVLFAGLGALAGAMLGEAWKGRTLGESWQIGQGAFWGRLLGSLAKVLIASIMAATATFAVFWLGAAGPVDGNPDLPAHDHVQDR